MNGGSPIDATSAWPEQRQGREPGGRAPRIRSSIRRLLVGYCMVVGLLCGGFAVGAALIAAAADRDRARALIEEDARETLDKLTGPAAIRREAALAIVLARARRDDGRVYRLSEQGRVLAGLPGDVRFSRAGGEWLEARGQGLIARRILLAPDLELLVGRRLIAGEQTRRLLTLSIALLALALAGALAVGMWASRRLTGRVDVINTACDRVRLGNFSVRVPIGRRGDEFDAIGRQVNAMLERIDVLVAGLRDVSARIAHDLRTPVARLKNDIEEAAAAPDLPTARRLAGAAAAETDEILQTFEALLDIAEVEAGGAGGLAPLRLDEAVRSALDLYESVAEEAGITISTDLAPAWVLGERMLIVRLVANLIDNAIKFAPGGTAIRVGLGQHDGRCVLCVSDSGPGIPAEERDRVLGRFCRGSSARGVKGHGLGLALVSAVAKRHGATVELADNAPGLVVRVAFECFDAG